MWMLNETFHQVSFHLSVIIDFNSLYPETFLGIFHSYLRDYISLIVKVHLICSQDSLDLKTILLRVEVPTTFPYIIRKNDVILDVRLDSLFYFRTFHLNNNRRSKGCSSRCNERNGGNGTVEKEGGGRIGNASFKLFHNLFIQPPMHLAIVSQPRVKIPGEAMHLSQFCENCFAKPYVNAINARSLEGSNKAR